MKVDIFRLVANRSDFVNSWLQSQQVFNAVSASPEAAAVREFLRMHDVSTDFYVLGPVMCLLGCPALAHELGLGVMPSSAFWNYRRPAFEMPAGLTLVASGASVPEIRRAVDAWPFQPQITFTVLDAMQMRVTAGLQTANINARKHANIVDVEWPTWSGLTGSIQLETPSMWAAGFSANITVEPATYPIMAALDALQKTTAWMTLLRRYGLLGHYASATNDHNERMGLIALALARDTAEQ